MHRVDGSGVLGDIDPEREEPVWQKKKSAAQPRNRKKERLEALEAAFAACDLEGSGAVKIGDLMDYTGKSRNTVKNWVDEHPDFTLDKGGAILKTDGVKSVKS